MSTQRVDFLQNRGRWMFDNTPQYGVALVVSWRRTPPKDHRVAIAGPATSATEWVAQSLSPGVHVTASSFAAGWMTPKLRSQDEADILARLRIGSAFPWGPGQRWTCFATQELNETFARPLWRNATDGWPLWKGESLNQFDPHGAEARICPTTPEVWQKVEKPRPGSGSVVARCTRPKDRRQAVLKELGRARVAFRDVSRSTDPRTVIACLVPPNVFLTNTVPYLMFMNGDERVQAACLGIMNSLLFDWQARRFAEIHMNFFILEALTVPDLSDNDFEEIAHAAARLSAVDDRFGDFAVATGVECGPLSEDARWRLRVEIDARVANAWEVTEADLAVMFDDFTTDAVPPAYRSALLDRLAELS